MYVCMDMCVCVAACMDVSQQKPHLLTNLGSDTYTGLKRGASHAKERVDRGHRQDGDVAGFALNAVVKRSGVVG